MPQDDTGDLSRRRADLEAQLRIAEEKRDKLLEQLAANRREPVLQGELPLGVVAQEVVLSMVEKVLTTVQPTMDMLTSVRADLIAEREKAERANDIDGAAEATEALHELSGTLVDLTTTVSQLTTLAATIRTSMKSGGENAANDKGAG